jgi:hypothetical protein
MPTSPESSEFKGSFLARRRKSVNQRTHSFFLEISGARMTSDIRDG